MSRELGRILRWRHASFLRRRLPFVWEVLTAPVRNWVYLATHPELRRVVRAVRRALAEGDTVIEA